MALQDFKCPNCGGAVQFDTSAGRMKCPFCDSEFSVEALSAQQGEQGVGPDSLDWNQTGGQTQWLPGEQEGMRVYVCKSCGGEIVADETTGATACPYCSNPVVMLEQFSGALRPDCVIPFKLDKRAAKEAMLAYVGKKKLVPKHFKDNSVLESIKGIYVPFWLYDATADAEATFDATRIRTWSDSSYNYTETSHYRVYRAGRLSFANVPVDGSKKMPDEMMESIEPYDFSEAVDFKTAYMSGFLADKYDVDALTSIDRANARVKTTVQSALQSTVSGYNSVVPTASSLRLVDSRTKYALYPVWILTTKYEGKQYTFAMNGQTGKIVGDLPVDKAALNRQAFVRFLITTGISTAALILLQLLSS